MQVNASELTLCIDAATLIAERSDIGTVVVITGDRSFLPLVRSIRNSGRRALVAAVNPPPPGSTPSLGEDDAYLDARNLLSQSSRDDLTSGGVRNNERSYQQRRRPQRRSNQRRETQSKSAPQSSRRFRSIDNPMARRTVEITEEHFGQYKEVYLTPLLRKLSDVLGEQHDPKSLVSELEAAGAVRLEKRDGYPYDYTVLILNQDHPDVQEIQDEYYSKSSNYNGSSDSYSDYDSYEDDYDNYEEEDYDDYEDASYEDADYDESDAYEDEYDEEDYDDPSVDEAENDYDEEAVDETK
jgi:hypothetical protein